MPLNTHSLDLELSSSQYAWVADNASLSSPPDVTIGAWVKLEQLSSTAGSNFVVAGKGDWGNTVNKREYYLTISTGDELFFSYSSDGGNVNVTSFLTDAAVFDGDDVGVWVHIAVAVDISAKTADFYKNGSGVADTITSSSATSIYNSDQPFWVGARLANTTYYQFADMKVDELRVHNTIRSQAWIAANKDDHITPDGNCVGYWRLNGNYNDEKGVSNLTGVNSPVFDDADVPFAGTEEEGPSIVGWKSLLGVGQG